MIYTLFCLVMVLTKATLLHGMETPLIPICHDIEMASQERLATEKDQKINTFNNAYEGICSGIEKATIFSVARWVPFFEVLQKESATSEMLSLMDQKESPLLVVVKKLSALPFAKTEQPHDEADAEDELKSRLVYILQLLGECHFFMHSKWLKQKTTPLITACAIPTKNVRQEVIKNLLVCNADPGESVTVNGEESVTPLQMAEKHGHQDIVTLLLEWQEALKENNDEQLTRGGILSWFKKKAKNSWQGESCRA